MIKKRRARTLALARALIYLAIAALVVLALRRLAVVLAPVGTALFLAYLANPLVERLERRGVRRGVAVLLLLLGFIAGVAAVLLIVPPLLAGEAASFAEKFDVYRQRAESFLLPWLRRTLHLGAGSNATDTLLGVLARFGSVVKDASGDVAAGVSRAIDTARGLLRFVVAAALTPVFAIFFLTGWPRLAEGARDLVPPRHREVVLGISHEVNQALAAWLRGQVLAMLLLATLYATGLAFARVPLGIGIGILTGLLAFVPYVGVLIGLALALAAAALDYHGPGPLIGVLITYGVVQTLDALVITPRIVGGRAGLSPVTVLFALSLGGELLGYSGLLLAVPSAAVARVLLRRAWRAYMASDFYRGDTVEKPTPKEGEPREQ